MNLRDANVQKTLLGVVLLSIVSYVYFGMTFLPFLYRVRSAEISLMQQEHAKLSADLEKARQMVGRLEQLEAEYQRLHEQWIAAQELLPEEQEMPDLLRKVTTAGNKSGIDFMLFQPTTPVVQEVYKSHPVQVRVRGGYHQFGVFMSRLANMDRIVNVSKLKINGQAERKGRRGEKASKSSDTIIADFTLTAYTLVEGAEVAAATPGGDENAQNAP